MRTDMALLVQTLDFLDQYVQDLQDAVLGDYYKDLDAETRDRFFRQRFQRLRQTLQACKHEAATR